MSDKTDKDVWDEKRLVLRLKQGQEDAFRILIRRFQTRLFGIAYGITLDREESRDIVQEVFLKVYRSIRGFREESQLSTWLYRITVNQCLNWQRRWKRRFRWRHRPLDQEKDRDDHELRAVGDFPEKLYEQKEFAEKMWQALEGLPEESRAAFVLKEIEGLSYEEISRALKIKKGTVSSRLFYVRQRLRGELKKYLEGKEAS